MLDLSRARESKRDSVVLCMHAACFYYISSISRRSAIYYGYGIQSSNNYKWRWLQMWSYAYWYLVSHQPFGSQPFWSIIYIWSVNHYLLNEYHNHCPKKIQFFAPFWWVVLIEKYEWLSKAFRFYAKARLAFKMARRE